MDTQHAAQGEALMGVSVEAGDKRSPADHHRGHFTLAVALSAVMGLVSLGLVIGFALHLFVITPSNRQESPHLTKPGKVYLSSKLRESEEKGRYDIFTVDKAASYFIYGWVKFSNATGEEVSLMQTLGENHQRATGTIQKLKLKASETEIFFNSSLLMSDGVRISIYFNSKHMDSLFHIYEL